MRAYTFLLMFSNIYIVFYVVYIYVYIYYSELFIFQQPENETMLFSRATYWILSGGRGGGGGEKNCHMADNHKATIN